MTEPAGQHSATEVPLRERLAVALDFDDVVEAQRMVRKLSPWFGVAKVGLELFCAVGPDAVASIASDDVKVFLDLKLHDIPTTVERAARVAGSLGASYLTIHAHGGVDMLQSGVHGFHDGAARAGLPKPNALAVTVLTSDPGAPPHVLARRVQIAAETGCSGIVCATTDIGQAKQIAPDLLAVVPGIRPPGAKDDDQARTATPRIALESGADLLVIGRPVTRAPDPAAAAKAICDSLA